MESGSRTVEIRTCSGIKSYLTINKMTIKYVFFICCQVNWTENVAKCCSLGMTPIILNTVEEQICISNFSRSKINITERFLFIFGFNLSQMERKPELLDGRSSGLQRFLGLVRWF